MSLSSSDKVSVNNRDKGTPLNEMKLQDIKCNNFEFGVDSFQSNVVEEIETESATVKTKVRYCSLCGSVIDNQTKKCSGCGKQYFKGVPWKRVITIILGVLLIASLLTNFVFYKVFEEMVRENDDLIERINRIETENREIESELKGIYKSFDKISRLVVVVEDDGTRLYHRFQCEKLTGETFLVYNLDTAKDKGYKPCSLCYNSNSNSELGFMDEVEFLLIADAVGDDYQISKTELEKLPRRELSWLMSKNVAFTCSDWKGLYHSVSCERLVGMCSVGIKSVVERDGFRPCPACQD